MRGREGGGRKGERKGEGKGEREEAGHHVYLGITVYITLFPPSYDAQMD